MEGSLRPPTCGTARYNVRSNNQFALDMRHRPFMYAHRPTMDHVASESLRNQQPNGHTFPFLRTWEGGIQSNRTQQRVIVAAQRRVPSLTKEAVAKVIRKRRSSSPGPDGIPFSVYRDLIDIVVHPLFLFVLHLSHGNRAIRVLTMPTCSFFRRTRL